MLGDYVDEKIEEIYELLKTEFKYSKINFDKDFRVCFSTGLFEHIYVIPYEIIDECNDLNQLFKNIKNDVHNQISNKVINEFLNSNETIINTHNGNKIIKSDECPNKCIIEIVDFSKFEQLKDCGMIETTIKK